MSTESLDRNSAYKIDENQDNINNVKLPPRRANMDVLRKRLLQEKKKEKKKDDLNCFNSCCFYWRFNNVNLLIF